MAARWFALGLLLPACEDGTVDVGGSAGFLQPCTVAAEDCPAPEMLCMQVTNQYTGFLTDGWYCTYECQDQTQCPHASCEEQVGTELACLESIERSAYCGVGRLGEAEFQVCGI